MPKFIRDTVEALRRLAIRFGQIGPAPAPVLIPVPVKAPVKRR